MSNNSFYLVIDDNSTDRTIASILLKKCLNNPEVHLEEGSKSAIEWIREKRSSIPEKLVILLDMLMPNVDGFGFLEAYESLDETLKDRNEIIMLSSMDEESSFTLKAKNHPLVKSVLPKPLNVDALKEVV